MDHFSNWRPNVWPFGRRCRWIDARRFGIRHEDRFLGSSGWGRGNNVLGVAIGTSDLLAHLLFRGMHQRAAARAFHGDVFGLSGEDLAGKRLLIGVPKLILFALEGRWNVLGFWRWRRWNDVRRPTIGALDLFADLEGPAVHARIANAAVESNVIGDIGVDFRCRRCSRQSDCDLFQAAWRGNNERRLAGGAPGSLADDRSAYGEPCSAFRAKNESGFRFCRRH